MRVLIVEHACVRSWWTTSRPKDEQRADRARATSIPACDDQTRIVKTCNKHIKAEPSIFQIGDNNTNINICNIRQGRMIQHTSATWSTYGNQSNEQRVGGCMHGCDNECIRKRAYEHRNACYPNVKPRAYMHDDKCAAVYLVQALTYICNSACLMTSERMTHTSYITSGACIHT